MSDEKIFGEIEGIFGWIKAKRGKDGEEVQGEEMTSY